MLGGSASQAAARQAGLSYGAVFDLYHARTKRVDLTTLDALCRTLKVSLCDLLEYVPDADEQ